jgi:hypothetical protein
MTDYAEPSLRKTSGAAARVRPERGVTFFPAFMIVAIVAMVVLALIAEARMTAEERAVLFEVYSYL